VRPGRTGRPAPPPLSFLLPCTPPPTPPHMRGRGGTPPGGCQRASRRSKSVRTPRGWLEPARGEFPAPNLPLGPPPVPHAGFLGHWEAQKSVECIDLSSVLLPAFLQIVVVLHWRSSWLPVRLLHRFLVCSRPCRQVSTTKLAPLGCYSSPSEGPAPGTASIRLPFHPHASGFWPSARSSPYHVPYAYVFPACQHKCIPRL
jgi:hypothetical protein